MTKAKMPVAKRRTSRAEDVRTGQVWTDELTFDEASAASVVQTCVTVCAFSGRVRIGGAL